MEESILHFNFSSTLRINPQKSTYTKKSCN